MKQDDFDNFMENNIFDVDSIFDKKPSLGYVLDEDIIYGKDYPTGYVDYDLFRILTCVNENHSLNDIFSNIELEGSFNEVMLKEILLDHNFVKPSGCDEDIDVKKIISQMPVTELSDLLNKYGVTASGKKKKLIKLASRVIPEHEFYLNEVELTDEGRDYLDNFKWIDFYQQTLDEFEFNEFYRYLDQHEGDFIQLGLDFIDEHFRKANELEDFNYCLDCINAKACCYVFEDNNLDDALKEFLKLFIFNLNPPYYSYRDFVSEYDLFYFSNIENIKHILSKVDINDLNTLFVELYNSMNFKKEYVSCDIAFSYLEKLLDGEDEFELSQEVFNKYFNDDDELFEVAMYYYGNEDYYDAYDLFKTLADKSPDDLNLLFYLADCYCYIGDVDSARDIIEKAFKIDENDARFWHIKALCYADGEDNENAIKCFKKSLEINPNVFKHWMVFGTFCVHKGDFETALNCFNKAIEINPEELEPKIYRARIYLMLNDWDNAEKYLNEIKEEYGEVLDYLKERTAYYLAQSNFEMVNEYCDKCLEIDGEVVDIWILKSIALMKLGDKKGAEQCSDRAMELNPMEVYSFLNNMEKKAL